MKAVHTFKWIGNDKAYLNEIHVEELGPLSIGLYSGNTNEDAVLAWCDPHGSWEFVMIFEAEHTTERAKFIIDLICERKEKLLQLFSYPNHLVFHHTHMYLLSLFTDETFIEESEKMPGQTDCLICFRKDQFVYWLSVGECFIYLFQPESEQYKQGRLNEQQFYERIGRPNVFAAATPCFTSGVRELQEGTNHIVVATDGITACGERMVKDEYSLHQSLLHVESLLEKMNDCKEQNSAAMIGWTVDVNCPNENELK